MGTTGADVVVSTVPARAGDVAAATVPAAHPGVLLDVVYAGWPTPLARAGRAGGRPSSRGLDMLVHQAAVQFVLFTGRAAPIEAMAAARARRPGAA